MQLLPFHFSYLLAFVTICSILSIVAHNADTGHHPSTLAELWGALHELGYKGIEGLPKPQPSTTSHNGSTALGHKGCWKTVSLLLSFILLSQSR